jgi:hypothetical protein
MSGLGFSDADVASILAYDPFSDDFGEGEVTVTDGLVVARKQHNNACFNCGRTIGRGEVHRRIVEFSRANGWLTTRFCNACCHAMVQFVRGNFAPMDQRTAMMKTSWADEEASS